jgi:hypothetical protein
MVFAQTVAVELVNVTCWCGIPLAVPSALYAQAQRSGQQIYCPVGHTFAYINTETDRLKRVIAEKDRLLSLRTREKWEAQNALVRAERKIRRVERGLCPHCNRAFQNVARHIKSKHATEV